MPLVSIFAYISDLSLNPLENVEMTAEPSGLQTSGNFILTNKTVTALSNASGLVSINVAPSIPMQVKIPKVNFTKWVTSPASGSLNVNT